MRQAEACGLKTTRGKHAQARKRAGAEKANLERSGWNEDAFLLIADTLLNPDVTTAGKAHKNLHPDITAKINSQPNRRGKKKVTAEAVRKAMERRKPLLDAVIDERRKYFDDLAASAGDDEVSDAELEKVAVTIEQITSRADTPASLKQAKHKMQSDAMLSFRRVIGEFEFRWAARFPGEDAPVKHLLRLLLKERPRGR
jgi:hypothetical protein